MKRLDTLLARFRNPMPPLLNQDGLRELVGLLLIDRDPQQIYIPADQLTDDQITRGREAVAMALRVNPGRPDADQLLTRDAELADEQEGRL